MTTVRFDTTAYEFSHGHKPRGTGMWAFRNKDRNDQPVFAPPWMRLSEAKRWVIKHLRAANGYVPAVLEVCP